MTAADRARIALLLALQAPEWDVVPTLRELQILIQWELARLYRQAGERIPGNCPATTGQWLVAKEVSER